jgi:PAS domain S-box-containing protein
MLEAVPDPIFVKNKHHQWIYGNEGFSKIIQMNKEQYFGKSDYDIFPKEMADVFWSKDKETLEGLKITENEEFILIDGKLRTILTKKTPYQMPNGDTILVGVIRDITERKTQEKTIENLFRMIENSSDVYCIFNLDGKSTYLNRAARDSGFTLEIKQFENLIQSNEQWEGEIVVHDVAYWVRLFKVRNELNEIDSSAIVATNLQHRKEIEAKLVYTSKMASLGEMAGGIAHEINNPLMAVSGYAEQIIRRYESGDTEKVLSDAGKIKETAFRISKIISGLLSFSRSAENEPEVKSDLSHLINVSLEFGRERMARHGIQITTELLDNIQIMCRPTQIQQVLINLFNNSLDAIQGTKEPWIRIKCEKQQDEIWVTVTDSGKGIPPHIRENIMTPFFTTKEVGKGTGLGLSISKGIMESNHGELIYVEDSPNTAFRLIFKLT